MRAKPKEPLTIYHRHRLQQAASPCKKVASDLNHLAIETDRLRLQRLALKRMLAYPWGTEIEGKKNLFKIGDHAMPAVKLTDRFVAHAKPLEVGDASRFKPTEINRVVHVTEGVLVTPLHGPGNDDRKVGERSCWMRIMHSKGF